MSKIKPNVSPNAPDDEDFLQFEDDDLICFEDTEERFPDSQEQKAGQPDSSRPWKILIVDDDPDVLMVTQLALAGLEVLGLPVTLIQASSFKDAQTKLVDSDVAVIITDAIMESEDAGLLLIDWVSKQKRFLGTRLVLRTGQPGRFQKNKILRDYNIHDYWPKTELTAGRMRTIIMGMIRSYQDIKSLSNASG